MPQAVRINATGQVEDTPVKVSKRNSDDVLWVATGNGGPWTITFDKGSSSEPSTFDVASGSPFSEPSYTVAQGASNGSTGGPVAGEVGKTYRYNVRNAAGTITHDPDVDVES
jgi:hypothetical protein